TLIIAGANDLIGASANPALARVGLRAGVAIVAGGAVRLGGIRAQAGYGIARARVMALIASGADFGIGAGAGPRLARIGLRASVAIVTGSAVRLGGIRALTCHGIARPRIMALIAGRTSNWIGARASAAVAGIGLRASVSIIAYGAIGLSRIRALA